MTWTIPDQGEAANDLQSELFQSSLDALAAADGLTGVVSGCAVTAQGSPNMTVAVAAGVVSVLGVQASVTGGNVTIGAADATNPRLDLVVANGSGTLSVIAGTAAAAPKEATLDTTTYVLLAQVYVPATATTITTARITDRRVIVPGTGMGLGVYGDGIDGVVTFDGTTTILGLAPASSVYTLTRDLYLANGSTINNGVTLKANGFRVFCAGNLVNNGTIHNNGGNGGGNGASAGATNGSATLSGNGGVGGNGGSGAGAAGTNKTGTAGGAGGAGGVGSGGAAGAGGTATAPTALQGGVNALRSVVSGVLGSFVGLGGTATTNSVFAGAGGGSGGGDGTHNGGAGGTGGGGLVVAAKTFSGTGAIQARGGNGGTPTLGNAAGGGGGGGGWVVVVSQSVSAGAITGQAVDANGGTHGNGVGTGTNGSDGSAGTVVLLPN